MCSAARARPRLLVLARLGRMLAGFALAQTSLLVPGWVLSWCRELWCRVVRSGVLPRAAAITCATGVVLLGTACGPRVSPEQGEIARGITSVALEGYAYEFSIVPPHLPMGAGVERAEGSVVLGRGVKGRDAVEEALDRLAEVYDFAEPDLACAPSKDDMTSKEVRRARASRCAAWVRLGIGTEAPSVGVFSVPQKDGLVRLGVTTVFY